MYSDFGIHESERMWVTLPQIWGLDGNRDVGIGRKIIASVCIYRQSIFSWGFYGNRDVGIRRKTIAFVDENSYAVLLVEGSMVTGTST